MADLKDRIISALQKKFQASLKLGAMEANRLSIPATPFFRGALRKEKYVKVISWSEVQAITGGPQSKKYARYQYNAPSSVDGSFTGRREPLRHKGTPEDGYLSFATGYADGSGRGALSQYRRGYNAQKDSVQKTRARWYWRLIINTNSRQRIINTVIRKFRSVK